MADTAWELTIIDAAPPSGELASITAGDIDGDGNIEIVTGGMDALLWYRPATQEKGVIAHMHGSVGVKLEDIDGDGILEAVTGDANPSKHIAWFKPGKSLHDPWTRYVIDDDIVGHTHDLLFIDLDGDGENELIANAVYCDKPGLVLYKRTADVHALWTRSMVQWGFVEEGLAAADLDGDGKIEIVSGPDWYHAPADGPFSGLWERGVFAPSHREMCRVALLDVTGSGGPDIFIVDSEYMDGRLSWFENRLGEEGEQWVEHVIEDGLIYAHSLDARIADDGRVRVFCAEMSQGGWNAPRNRVARVIEYYSADKGKTWERTLLSRGEGTHEAKYFDIDGDGALEIYGKDAYENIQGTLKNAKVHVWKEKSEVSPLTKFRHRYLDRDKPGTAIDLLVGDIDGDGESEILCGEWWYRLHEPGRHEIPGIHQVIALYDIDGDGRLEVVATKRKPGAGDFWNQLSSILVWIKPIDLASGQWEEHPIGEGSGNWPHGVLMAPLFPNNGLALITGYHNAGNDSIKPEIWEVPSDPTQPWPKKILADITYGEEFVAADIDNDGKLDVVAGAHWLQNMGDGTFTTHVIVPDFKPARVSVGDFNGNGLLDVVLGEEVLDFTHNMTPASPLCWFENPGVTGEPWKRHVIDTVRCAHSTAVADLDGDGEDEIICGEHDPFWAYRNQCHLYVYKKADLAGLTWTRFTLDERFEHHDGTRIVPLPGGKLGIASHGWRESIYVHLWEPPTSGS